jgi:putative DNA primase/helicase
MSSDDESNVVPFTPVADAGKGGATPPPPAGKKRERKPRDKRAEFFDLFTRLTERCVLIRGTTSVYDGNDAHIIKIDALRLIYGKDVVEAWLRSPLRRSVHKDDVIFDPTGATHDRPVINLFAGLELSPKAGECTRILELLKFLCSESGDQADAVYEWVLRWLAYPLQHLGAKMQTAIVLHGAEGTGKNLFFSVMERIYGRYSTIVGQAQLESPYNGWLSAKLFIVGNEVLGRKEKWELKGALKNIITEPRLMVEEKYQPVREEANHANLVFLSNEFQPLVPGENDRRYMVIENWKPHAGGEAWYRQIREEIDAGGAAAFFDYLRRLPMDGFGPHSKPLTTTAKTALIELGRSSTELFLAAWRGRRTRWYTDQDVEDGLVPCAPAEGLYRAYCAFCDAEGERHKQTRTMFWRIVAVRGWTSRLARWRLSVDSPQSPLSQLRQRTFYVAGFALGEAVEDADAVFMRSAQLFELRFADEPADRVRG